MVRRIALAVAFALFVLSPVLDYAQGTTTSTVLFIKHPNAMKISKVTDLEAISTGSGKISLYWGESFGASGYNIYRSRVSGRQNYAKPVNGNKPVTSRSFPGSDTFIFTDTKLSNGKEYFYTVKAVKGRSESIASNEDSDSVDPNAIPWDTRNPALILPAFRDAFKDEPLRGNLRVAGPDGSIYEDGQAKALPPDVTIVPGTNVAKRADGEEITLPPRILDASPPTKQEKQLWKASALGNIKEVKRLIASGVNVNAFQYSGYTALTFAVVWSASPNKRAVAELLLQNGAEVDPVILTDGATPLFHAAKAGDFALTQLLLKHGAKANALDGDNSTIMWVTQGISVEEAKAIKIIDLLIEHGADVNAKSSVGNTALSLAKQNSRFNVARFLVEKGAKE